MKFEKQVSLKLAMAIVLIAILVSSSLVYVFAVSPSSTFTISSGVYPGAPSYTIWREGSNYFAKDANGLLACSGTNPTSIWNSIIASNIHIYFASGLYTIPSTLQISNMENITVNGGGASTILQAAVSLETPILQVNGTDAAHKIRGITISDLKFLGAPSGAQIRQTCIQFNFVMYSTIESVYVHHSRKYGILLYYSDCIRVENVEIWENLGGAGLVLWCVADSVVTGVKIVGSGTAADPQPGIGLWSVGTTLITGCQVDTNGGHGIDMADCKWIVISGCSFYDNDFLDLTSYDGISIGGDSDYNVVVGNTLRGNDRYGINIGPATCNDNIIVGNSCVGDQYEGIHDTGTGTQIHNCYNGTSWIS